MRAPSEPISEEAQLLDALVLHRDQLVKQRTTEMQYRESVTDEEALRSMNQMLKQLDQ